MATRASRLFRASSQWQYAEVTSIHAVHQVLQKCQNQYMPRSASHGRQRPVTVSQVTHEELLNEARQSQSLTSVADDRQLRPRSASELFSLLALCQAAISASPLPSPASHGRPTGHSGTPHFVKSRLGPYHALMSILSKTEGRTNPAYWDLFREFSCDSIPHCSH